MKLKIDNLLRKYTVKLMGKGDGSAVYNLCSKNTLYYDFYPPFVTVESIEADMTAHPPGKIADDKYYLGFFDSTKLIATMDLCQLETVIILQANWMRLNTYMTQYSKII